MEWWWSEGGVVVVGPPTSSTVIQRRWEGLTPGVASLESWSGLLAGSCAQFILWQAGKAGKTPQVRQVRLHR